MAILIENISPCLHCGLYIKYKHTGSGIVFILSHCQKAFSLISFHAFVILSSFHTKWNFDSM